MGTLTAANPDIASLYAAHIATLQQRVATALEGSGFDGLILLAGDLDYPGRDDIALPFRVEPHFAAWLPLSRHPGCALRIEPGRRPLLAYLQTEDFWHTPPRHPEGFWVQHFDIRVTKSAREAERVLRATDGRLVVIGARAGAGSDDPESDGGIRNVLKYLDFHRAFKTEYELRCMQLANRIAVGGHAATGRDPRGKSEFALDQTYCGATRQRETELPYPSIVAVNEHASVLHYEQLDRDPPKVTRSFLLDAGASCNGYAADVTRTWSEPGSPFADLVSSVDAMQQTICEHMIDGADFVTVNDRTHQLLAAVLRQHELIGCSAEAAYDSGLTRAFLPHGLGHLLGLQVHDIGGRQVSADGEERAPPEQHPFLRLTRTLSPNMTVTVEPGLYFIASILENAPGKLRKQINWRTVDALRPYGGIRIEDDVVVTKGPCTNLTREAFKDLELEQRTA